MKRIIPLILVFALALTACGGKSGSAKSPEELTKAYSEAVTAAQTGEAMGVEIITSTDADMADFVFAMLGVTPEDMTAFALSMSLMNVKAYAICAAMPAEGHEEAVKKGFQGYVDTQRSNFEQYLQDQYEVAKSARVETLGDGTVLLVMSEDTDGVLAGLQKALG